MKVYVNGLKMDSYLDRKIRRRRKNESIGIYWSGCLGKWAKKRKQTFDRKKRRDAGQNANFDTERAK